MFQRDTIIEKRMEALRPVPAQARIIVKRLVRNRIFKSFRHFVRQGEYLDHAISYSITTLGFVIVAPALAFLVLIFWKGDGSIGPAIISENWEAAAFLVFLAEILVFGLRELSQAVSRNNSAFLKSHAEKFDQENAKHWSKAAKISLESCAKKQVADPVISFSEDKKLPFRILAGYLPVPIFELRRPEEFIEKKLSVSEQKAWEKERKLGEKGYL